MGSDKPLNESRFPSMNNSSKRMMNRYTTRNKHQKSVTFHDFPNSLMNSNLAANMNIATANSSLQKIDVKDGLLAVPTMKKEIANPKTKTQS